jgi:hypothetical protein
MDRQVADAGLETHGNVSARNVADGHLTGYAAGGTEILTEGRSSIF